MTYNAHAKSSRQRRSALARLRVTFESTARSKSLRIADREDALSARRHDPAIAGVAEAYLPKSGELLLVKIAEAGGRMPTGIGTPFVLTTDDHSSISSKIKEIMTATQVETPASLANNYTFIRLIGEGTQATTHLAKRLSDGNMVAIKGIRFTKVANLKSYDLFKREAEVLRTLHVAGVPKFFESVFDDNGDCWIVQEYIEAPSLMEHLNARGRFGENMTLTIMSSIADVLIELQTKYTPPVIHRDIKPSNILCNLNAEPPHVWLIDFGAVANPMNRSGGSTVAGTFGYMAIEQFVGNAQIQSDFYSLGATALHLLTGASPADMPVKGLRIDLDQVLARYAPDTTPQMRALLDHLLENEIDKRPATAQQLKSEIEAAIAGTLIAIPKPDEQHQVPPEVKNSFWKRLIQRFGEKKSTPQKEKAAKKSANEWQEVIGEVRSLNNEGNLEYTFEIDGRLWAGRYPANHNEKTRKTPWPCHVLYCTADPSRNRLLSENELNTMNHSEYSETVNERDENGKTPLIKAKTKADPNVKGANGYPILFQKDIITTPESIKVLHGECIDVNALNPNGYSALTAAAETGSEDSFKMLLDLGADPNIKLPNGEPVMFYNDILKHHNYLKMLIDAGADPNAKNQYGTPLLIDDDVLDDPKFVKYLLDAGADPNATFTTSSNLQAPILFAPRVIARKNIFKMLIDAGANPNAKAQSGLPLLIDDDVLDDPELVKYLLDAGADPNAIFTTSSNIQAPILFAPSVIARKNIFKMLIDAGANPNAKAQSGLPLLIDDDVLDDPELVKYLLDAGADPNATFTAYTDTSDIQAPILFAPSVIAHKNIYKMLLDAGANPNAKANSNTPLLIYDDVLDDPEIVKLLLDAGADPNATYTTADRMQAPILYSLHVASRKNIYKMLLDAGADPNATYTSTTNLQIPILFAQCIKNKKILRMLLDAGADPNLKAQSSYPILVNANVIEDPEIMKLLLDAGADPNATYPTASNSETPIIFYPNIMRNTTLLKMLLEAGADPNAQNPDGQTLLEFDDVWNSPELVMLLLTAGADPNIKDNENCSILFHKFVINNPEMIKHLHRAGMDINALNALGYPALAVAAKFENEDTFKTLLALGANPNIKNSIGVPVLFYEKIFCNTNLLEPLIAAGADVNALNPWGESILSLPQVINRPDVFKLLLDAGANPNAVTNGFPLIMNENILKHPECLKMLLEAGADPNARNAYGTPVLLLDTVAQDPKIFQMLVEFGANLDISDSTSAYLSFFNNPTAIKNYANFHKKKLYETQTVKDIKNWFSSLNKNDDDDF